MRLKIELASDKNVVLPVGFNSNIQALIYNFLDRVDAKWLHDEGYKFEKRSFKLFNFSYILERGRYIKNEKLFIFPHQISFYISSPVEWVLEQFAKNTIISDKVRLGNNLLSVHSINVIKPPSFDKNTVKIRAITPIEVHSTLNRGDGKKLTYYYTPYEKEFGELINVNLQRKWTALFKEECIYSISIKPLFSKSNNERIVYFGTGLKKTIVKGWKGYFELKGEPEFLKFAYDTGLGSRGSQGFGMVELVNLRR